MSPRASLTTNVLPSRILTRPSLIVPPRPRPRSVAARRPGKSRWKSTSSLGSPSTPTSPRSTAAIAFTSPVDDPVEERPVRRARRSRRRRSCARHAIVALVDGHEPALGPLAVDEVEANAALRLLQQRLVPRRPSSAKNSAVGSGVPIPPTRANLVVVGESGVVLTG